MINKIFSIAVVVSSCLLGCGGGGSDAKPPMPAPPNINTGLFLLAGVALDLGSNDGVGANAHFSGLLNVKSDNVGNIYVADDTAVRKVTANGVVTTIAGINGQIGATDGVGAAARFGRAAGMAIDADGNLYVADAYNHVIRKITPAGMVTTPYGKARQAGSADGEGNDARFKTPVSLAFDNTGNLFVVDAGNHTIRKINTKGVVSTFVGRAGLHGSVDGNGASACFNNPGNIDIDSASNLYVTDPNNRTIRKISANGNVSTLAGDASRGAYPNAIGCSDAQESAVTEGNFPVLDKFGNFPGVDGFGKDAIFFVPLGLAVDPRGDIYISDMGSSSIRKITPEGMVSTVAGVNGVPGNKLGSLPGLLRHPFSVTAIGPGMIVTNSEASLVKIVLP